MFLFFDVETTGLPRRRNAPVTELENWPRVVSVAWRTVDSRDRVISEKHFVVRPDGFRIPEEASRIHGITDLKARESGVPFAVVSRWLLRDLKKAEVRHLVAHNLEFDRPILTAEFLRSGQGDPFSGLSGHCTMQLAAGRLGWRRISLSDACRQFLGRGHEDAHHALADVRACCDLFFALRRPSDPAGRPGAPASRGAPAAARGSGSLPVEELIDLILEQAEDRPDFDPGFVYAMRESLETYGHLTDAQEQALWNIARGWQFI